MSKHTAGPWRMVKEHDEINVIAGEHVSHGFKVRFEIARCIGGHHGDEKANGRLIAAAPELLEALKWYVENDDTNEGQEGNDFWLAGRDRARVAIAKATGKIP